MVVFEYNKGCFGNTMYLDDRILPVKEGFTEPLICLLETISNNDSSCYDDYECETCGDFNYSQKFEVDSKYIDAISFLFLKK